MKKLFLTVIASAFSSMLIAQVLDVSPAFPTVNDVVTITYDATKGNAALIGQSQIYAHAGLITTASTSSSNWQYVQGNWGTVDPQVAMTNIGNNKHTITIDIDQFYGYPIATTTVLKLAFVFRTATGSLVGRNADGSDIFYDVYPVNAGLLGQFFHPDNGSIYNLNDAITISAESNTSSVLQLKQDGNVLTTLNNATILDYNLTASTPGTHLLEFEVNDGTSTIIDSVYYTVNPTVNIANPPIAGLVNGVNYINDTTVILQLYAPQKQHIYVIGDFNNWTPTAAYHMNLSTNNATWWLEISGLTAGQKYGYQYFIDGTMKLADPMSALILDPNNDGAINAATNPNPLPYPTGQTTGFVTVMQPAAPQYTWQNTSYQGPAKKDLVIYELLVRDFVAKHNYQTLIDTLSYLDALGIKQLAVIGHSMGGKMAWTLAAAEPERVTKLVLMAPDGYPDDKDIGSRPYAMPAAMGVIQYFLPRYFVRKSIEPAFANPQTLSDELIDRYDDMLKAPGVRGAILDRAQQTIYTDPVPRLKSIKAPTLLLWGEQDQMIPSGNAQRYASQLVNVRTVLIPQLGHVLQEEQPEKGLAKVLAFLVPARP